MPLSPLPTGLPHHRPLITQLRDVLRTHRQITFMHVDAGQLGGDKYGEVIAVDDHAWIFLDDSCTGGEYVATLAHELTHLAHPDELDDAVIEWRAAELLIPLTEALAATTVEDIEAVALRHGVDSQMVRARGRTPPPPRHNGGEQVS